MRAKLLIAAFAVAAVLGAVAQAPKLGTHIYGVYTGRAVLAPGSEYYVLAGNVRHVFGYVVVDGYFMANGTAVVIHGEALIPGYYDVLRAPYAVVYNGTLVSCNEVARVGKMVLCRDVEALNAYALVNIPHAFARRQIEPQRGQP